MHVVMELHAEQGYDKFRQDPKEWGRPEGQIQVRGAMATEKQKVPNLEPDDSFGCLKRNPRKCRACANAHGPAPWEDSPDKSYRMAYERRLGNIKPDAVYSDGTGCPFYAKEA